MISQQKHLRAIVNQDGAAILDNESGTITTLNATGAMVWQALERGDSAEAITARLRQLTGEPIEAIREDLATFIEALTRQNLLP